MDTWPARDRLARLRAEHRASPYPAGFRGVDLAGVELILVDVDVAGAVERELTTGLDGEDVAVLWWCLAGLARAVPLISDPYCAAYFTRVRTMAELAVGAHTPPAL